MLLNQSCFKGTTLLADPTVSLKGKQKRIISLINRAFRDNKISGSAALKQQLIGTGAPCCDFQILVNSCATFDLLDGEGTPLDKVCSNPYVTVSKDPRCVGCDPAVPMNFTCGMRAIGDPTEIVCDCSQPVDRKEWYHREVKFVVPEGSNWL